MAVMVLAGTVTGVTISAPTVAADGGDTLLGDVFEGDTSDKIGDGFSAVWAGLGGARERAGWRVSNWFGGDPSTASEEANGLASYYNANNATLEAWANSRKNWTSNHTVKITLHLDDETATRYLVATAEGGNITSSSMVKTTNRTADHSIDLCGYAADQANEELRTFTEEYASKDKDVDADLLGRMRGAYAQDVETTLYDSSGSCGGDS